MTPAGSAIHEAAELMADLREMKNDRDSMKAWAVALYAHVCQLTGKKPADGPKEIAALTASWTAAVRAQAIKECAAVAFQNGQPSLGAFIIRRVTP